jgi:hypothetical protein
MRLDELTREQKRATLNELRQALFQHDLWYENFNRIMICNQAPDDRDVAEDAHRRWPFGKWLYTIGADRLGLTLLDPNIPVEASIDRADKALRAAKVAGRDRIAVWSASMI